SARVLSTGLIPHGAVDFEMEFDFIAGILVIRVSDGGEPYPANPFTAARAASGVFSITVSRSGRSPRARMTGAGSGSNPSTSETKAPNLDGWAVDRATIGAPLRSRRRAAASATA